MTIFLIQYKQNKLIKLKWKENKERKKMSDLFI